MMQSSVNDMQPADLLAAISSLVAGIRRPESTDLWDAEDIAIYLRIAKKTVQNSLLNKPSFPREITLPVGGRRWLAGEVKAWALRHR